MQYLLDTHAFIWFINGDESLPPNIRKEISDVNNKIFMSIASLWEIAIKYKLGKLELRSSFDNIAQFMSDNDIEILPITFSHLNNCCP